MEKNSMQDIIPPEKRSIRRISIERARRAKNASSYTPEIQQPEPNPGPTILERSDENTNPYDHLPPQPPLISMNKRRWWLWALGIVLVLAVLVLVVSFVFAGASVEVTPRQENILLDAQFKADREPVPGDLGFEIMSITKRMSDEVDATGEKFVEQKASGQIVVFNNFDENNQRLIKNTRFETDDGLVYRIDKSVVVPGQHENESGETVPGSVEVTVYADASGKEFNIGLTDFTIPGFDGDPRFFKFYARSKTSMTGGFSGNQKTVSPSDESRVRNSLQDELRDVIRGEAQSQVPEGFVLYDDGVFVSFASQPNESTDDDDRVLVVEEALLHGIIFNEQDLARLVAVNTVASYEGGDVEVLGIDTLDFSIVDIELVEPLLVETIDFTLSGSDIVVWLFDEQRLKEDLAGKHRRDTEMVLSAYPAIEEAQVVLRPFWKRLFPENPEKIKVKRNLDES